MIFKIKGTKRVKEYSNKTLLYSGSNYVAHGQRTHRSTPTAGLRGECAPLLPIATLHWGYSN
ncbi:MAG: hypothetical protein LBR26_08650 [Prevotella sp.]|nr:hypothetical protein [Prevotella sp.]